jgi:lipopolysaccharide heptosyltransferase II
MSLLVRIPRWLGDVVMAEPALRALERRFGGSMTLAGAPGLLELIAPSAPRARHLACGRRPDPADWRGFDTALLLDGSVASAWVALRAGIPERVGWAVGPRGLLLTDGPRPALERGRTPLGLGRHRRRPRKVPRPFGASAQELVARLGVWVDDPCPRLEVQGPALESARAWRAGAGVDPATPFLLLQAGARPGSAKGIPAERWARVIGELRELGFEAPVFALAGPGEEPAAREVAQAAGVHAVVDPVANLPELLAWCSDASLVLCTDSGPRHLARAAGATRVTLIGPTDPRHTSDAQVGERLLRVELDCGPCHRERCPLDGVQQRACMLDISPGRIADAVLELWP